MARNVFNRKVVFTSAARKSLLVLVGWLVGWQFI
jgi:hypothetical protein